LRAGVSSESVKPLVGAGWSGTASRDAPRIIVVVIADGEPIAVGDESLYVDTTRSAGENGGSAPSFKSPSPEGDAIGSDGRRGSQPRSSSATPMTNSASPLDRSPDVAQIIQVPASELPRLRDLATRLVEALYGRQEPEAERVAFGDVELDMSVREVRRAGRPVNLTPREYGILAELARHRGEPVTYRKLLEVVWGPQYTREVHYLRVYMSSLRRKLERDRRSPRYLLTQGGVGYMLAA